MRRSDRRKQQEVTLHPCRKHGCGGTLYRCKCFDNIKPGYTRWASCDTCHQHQSNPDHDKEEGAQDE